MTVIQAPVAASLNAVNAAAVGKPKALVAAALLGLLSACSGPGPVPPSPGGTGVQAPADPRVSEAPKGAGGQVLPPKGAPSLAPPKPVRHPDALRLQAAQRLVAANPHMTYLGEVPDVLLAIPVLEIELNSDGSVRRIDVLRHPGQARDTTQLAIDAVRRAAPFGDVSRMPKPWKFTETFLFNDQRHFKPRTLDL